MASGSTEQEQADEETSSVNVVSQETHQHPDDPSSTGESQTATNEAVERHAAASREENRTAASMFNAHGIVRVDFVFLPEEYGHTMDVATDDTAAQLSQSLQHALSLDQHAHSLQLSIDSRTLDGEQTLADVGVQAGERITVSVRSVRCIDDSTQRTGHLKEPSDDLGGSNGPLGTESDSRKAMNPTRLDVDEGDVDNSYAEEETLHQHLPTAIQSLEIDRTQMIRKPYRGGYRSKLHGTVFYHADTQTEAGLPTGKKRAEDMTKRYERETQTKNLRTVSVQTRREAATQMERKDLVLDCSRDVIVEPRPELYMTADEYEQLKDAKAVEIQRWVRGWLGRRKARNVARLAAERYNFYKELQEREQEEQKEKQQHEKARRMNPKTSSDFKALHSELEQWRLRETADIKASGLSPEEKQQALQDLLQRETRLLQTVDRLRINSIKESAEQQANSMMSTFAAPKQWQLTDGKTVQVHTESTTRAAELKQMYDGLKMHSPTIDERLDVLLQVKWTVKEFDTDLTRELVQLIDREADLLDRGRSTSTLDGLRRRIQHLFLHFSTIPDFNPESKQYSFEPPQKPTPPSLEERTHPVGGGREAFKQAVATQTHRQYQNNRTLRAH